MQEQKQGPYGPNAFARLSCFRIFLGRRLNFEVTLMNMSTTYLSYRLNWWRYYPKIIPFFQVNLNDLAADGSPEAQAGQTFISGKALAKRKLVKLS